MEKVLKLATQFRKALENAQNANEFQYDICFYQFPRACCGDTSDLLGQYLLESDIRSRYVCGTYYDDDTSCESQSHAWLLLKDGRIVDITGDQFRDQRTFLCYDQRIYVGKMDTFHRLFEVDPCRDIHDSVGVQGVPRLQGLYQTILRYIR